MNPSFELQKQIRDNAEDVRTFVSDLRHWEEEMRKKEAECLNASNVSVENIVPPIRNNGKKRDCSESSNSQCPEDIQSAKKRISSNDYAAWEKFDVEKACEEVDLCPIKTSQDIPETDEEKKIMENKLRDEANFEKEKGNQFVKKERWDSAIECYSRAIKCYPKDAIYFCNRALCYLKKKEYRSAETDCTSALTLDSTYVKALHRRGLARKELNQLLEAREDFKRAMEFEPSNTAIQRDYNAVDMKIVEFSLGAVLDESVVQSASELVLDLADPLTLPSDPILPAKKHRVSSSSSHLLSKVSGKQDWPKVEDAQVVEPIYIPPHRRSKKPLHRIVVEEISSMTKSVVSEVHPVLPEKDHIQEVCESVPSITKTVSITDCSPLLGEKVIEKRPSHQSLTSSVPKIVPPVPKNSVQFISGWRQVKGENNLCFKYLKQIPGRDVPNIFQDSLDGNILSEIIFILASQFVKAKEPVIEYLLGLTQVKRFRTLILFMSTEDKKNVSILLDHVKTSEEVSNEVLSTLKKDYELS